MSVGSLVESVPLWGSDVAGLVAATVVGVGFQTDAKEKMEEADVGGCVEVADVEEMQ